MRKIWIALVLVLLFPVRTLGQEPLLIVSPSVILVEQATGKVLYADNDRARMYPASLTKIVTALVAVDYLDMDEIIVIGPEIKGVPQSYSTPIHSEGDWITVRNLLRALMIRSGNETGHVLVINTIRAKEGRQNVTFEEADRQFSALMNQKARELGAMESHFNNSYGFHSENHYTTAYDMAILARAYLRNTELAALTAQGQYIGDSLEGRMVEGAQVRAYEWTSLNTLLPLPDNINAHPYVTGLKTGFTDEAGFCLVASADKMGLGLVAVVMRAPEIAYRFQDARVLLDYGYFHYAMRTVQSTHEYIDTVVIANPRLGEGNLLQIKTGERAEALLSLAEHERVQRVLVYDPGYLPDDEDEFETDEDDHRVHLKAPIEQNAQVGAVQYILDGQLLYEGPLLATTEVAARNLDSDMDFYIQEFKDVIFTARGIPYWFGIFGTLFGIIGIVAAVKANRGNRDRFGGYRGYR